MRTITSNLSSESQKSSGSIASRCSAVREKEPEEERDQTRESGGNPAQVNRRPPPSWIFPNNLERNLIMMNRNCDYSNNNNNNNNNIIIILNNNN